MLFSTQQRVETILQTIDRLGIVKIKHLLEIHDLKSYKNACRIIRTQLRPFIHETYFQKEKVMYLNKKGKEMIASEKEENKISMQTIHFLLRNEVYIHFNCPIDWQNEYSMTANINPKIGGGIIFNGLTLPSEKKVVADAVFKRNGYLHIIEVDNTQDMKTNKKKIDLYREILPAYSKQVPILYFFTKTESRKQKLQEWLKGIHHKVLTFEEIR